MRYSIKAGNIVESILIDAPYDTLKDAREAIASGVYQNDERDYDGPIMKSQTVMFQIGTRVVIKRDYQEDASPWRQTVGIVKGHKDSEYGNDNLVEFDTGEIEPFGNWEIEAFKE